MRKSNSKSNNYWVVESWWVQPKQGFWNRLFRRKQQIPRFDNPPEKTGPIEQNGPSGHVTYIITGTENKFYFKLNKKNNKNLSVQEVLAGAPWRVCFPQFSSNSELVYNSQSLEVMGTISTGLQDWYALSEKFPLDDKEIEPHKIYVHVNEGQLEYKVKYPASQVQTGFITHAEVSQFFEKREDKAPDPNDSDYIQKSFKAILDVTAKRKHTEPSHILKRDCQFNDDKTDYYSLAGVMVYSHTHCEDDLHRQNIIVIHKEGKDYYYRIDFDMSYQSLTEKHAASFMGIKENVRSTPRAKLVEVKITPQSFKTFPMGIHEPLHFWPGVRRPVVGGEKWWHTLFSFFGWRASDKGWDEAQNSDQNLTRQFTDLAYHPEFIKWKIYHYARYITTPPSLIDKEMESKIAKMRQAREDKVLEVAELRKKGDPQLARAEKELEMLYNDEATAHHIKHRLLSEDQDRRLNFIKQLMKIPEFTKGVIQHKEEFLNRLKQDNADYKTKYGATLPDIDQDLEKYTNRFEELYDACVNKVKEQPDALVLSIKREKIYKENTFKEQIASEMDLQKLANIVNTKRMEIRNSGLFTDAEQAHFEKMARERKTQILLFNLTKKINDAKNIIDIKKIMTEANHDLREEPKALSQIDKLIQQRKDVLESEASLFLPKSLNPNVIKFLKYAGGCAASLLLAKVMLPPPVFHAVRILGVDVFRNMYTHVGLWAGGMGILGASTAWGISFFSKKNNENLLVDLEKVYQEVLEICKNSGEKLSGNHPSDVINSLIHNIQYKQSSSIEALKNKFEMNDDDDNSLLINQLKELSQAFAPQEMPALKL